ncbi:MAG: DUF4278 domain-containing protein [Elainellaceae cyanobacterium]
MKLTYRGTSYNYNPPAVQYGDPIATGTYRGLDIRFRNPKKPLVLPSTLDLKYRGASVNPAAQPVSQPVAQPTLGSSAVSTPVVAAVEAVVSSVDNLARSLMLNETRQIKQRQQDMLSRLATEVGVSADEVAQHWGHIQGKLHPSFRNNYGRGGATMS